MKTVPYSSSRSAYRCCHNNNITLYILNIIDDRFFTYLFLFYFFPFVLNFSRGFLNGDSVILM